MSDWYRKSQWSEADREDFETRLARARRASRPQYLRIQAVHLAEASMHEAALELLRRVLGEYDDPVQRAPALAQQGQSFDAIDDVPRALEAYRGALTAEREFPQVRTRAMFEFPLFVLRRNLRELFGEAIEALDSVTEELPFPQDRFDSACARSLIAAELGDRTNAKLHAQAALTAAYERRSWFIFHRTVGLVRADASLMRRLRRLAG